MALFNILVHSQSLSAQSRSLQALQQEALRCLTLLEGTQVQNTELRDVLHLDAEIFLGYIIVVKPSFRKSSFEEFKPLYC